MNIIKFSAPWCEPCKAYGPVFLKTVELLKVQFGEIDLDKTPEVWAKYRVMSVPTTIIEWYNWEILFRESWPLTEAKLTEVITEHFKL